MHPLDMIKKQHIHILVKYDQVNVACCYLTCRVIALEGVGN